MMGVAWHEEVMLRMDARMDIEVEAKDGNEGWQSEGAMVKVRTGRP